ncbi:MAG: hypothetical protein U0573_01330 [Phycisphaerales bacterium]|nr:DUF4239 domain-containing protein [Planctomycetota bacterium]
MNVTFNTGMVVLLLMAGVLICIECGRRIGLRRRKAGSDPSKSGTGATEAAVFGLLGLLVAFTFSGAASRFDARRLQIVEEANAIGTAYLRVDLLPEDVQPEIRELFRAYTDARIATYHAIPDLEKVNEENARAMRLQSELWKACVGACKLAPSPAVTSMVIPAVNELIDVSSRRTAAAQAHVPWIVMAALLGLAMGCSLLAGFDMAADKFRSWTHQLVFALTIGFVVFVIFDLEYPRLGLIRIEAFDRYMEDARRGMDGEVRPSEFIRKGGGLPGGK